MDSFNNPLADLANKLGTVRVVWGIVGTIVATLGFTIPFVSPDLFTVTAFDNIIEFIVGTVGAAFTLYQAYGRKVVVEAKVRTQDALTADIARVEVGYFNVFGDVTV